VQQQKSSQPGLFKEYVWWYLSGLKSIDGGICLVCLVKPFVATCNKEYVRHVNTSEATENIHAIDIQSQASFLILPAIIRKHKETKTESA
jgi:hypothetical protein